MNAGKMLFFVHEPFSLTGVVMSAAFGLVVFYKKDSSPSRPISPLSTAMRIQSEHAQKALPLSNRPFKQLFGVKRQTAQPHRQRQTSAHAPILAHLHHDGTSRVGM